LGQDIDPRVINFLGDLHDGTGLSDTTTPDGVLSNKVFEELSDYDLLTIGEKALLGTRW